MQGTRSNSSFFSVIDMEIAEIATRFWLFRAYIGIVALLLVGVVLVVA